MDSPVWRLLEYSLIPVACMSAAGALALFRSPCDRWRSAILHFAAGVVFAAAALELLPKLVHQGATLRTAVGFVLGTGTMLGLRRVSYWLEKRSKTQAKAIPLPLLTATGVDLLVDGCLIGVGFATGGKTALYLTIALAMEAVSLGLSLAATLVQRGEGRPRILASVCGLAAMFTVGALGAGLPLRNASHGALTIIIAFGTPVLLFLVTEELLTEAHEVPETSWLTAAFFVGFLAYLLLEMLGGS